MIISQRHRSENSNSYQTLKPESIVAFFKPRTLLCQQRIRIFSCHLANTTVYNRRPFVPLMFGNKRKIRRWDARPRYCTATCCTPRALPHHNKLWFIKYYDFSEKYSPGCAFPPQTARRRHNPFKYNTKATYHVWNDDFWQRYCVMRRRGGNKAQELMLGKIGFVSQPGHWRSISLFTPRDAQSDSRIFFNYLSPSQNAFLSLITKGYYAWMYLLIVHWQQEKQGRCR